MPHELRRGKTDYEDNVSLISRNLVIGTNCTLLTNSVVSLVFMVLVGLVLASVVGLRPCGCFGHDEFDLPLNVTVLHCNARTSSKDVLQKLRQFCSINTGTSGRIYRPKKGRRLIFYMKDINFTSPDKYNASEIVMFLSQVAIHNGFYDDDLEFQCGDVPGIWTPDELMPLLAPLKEEWTASQGRGAVQPRTSFEYFVHQVCSHMRIVLSIDANRPHFLTFCAANPALFSCCHVMSLDDWNKRACTSWSSGS